MLLSDLSILNPNTWKQFKPYTFLNIFLTVNAYFAFSFLLCDQRCSLFLSEKNKFLKYLMTNPPKTFFNLSKLMNLPQKILLITNSQLLLFIFILCRPRNIVCACHCTQKDIISRKCFVFVFDIIQNFTFCTKQDDVVTNAHTVHSSNNIFFFVLKFCLN